HVTPCRNPQRHGHDASVFGIMEGIPMTPNDAAGRRSARWGGAGASASAINAAIFALLTACQGVVLDERDAMTGVETRVDGGVLRADAMVPRSDAGTRVDGGTTAPIDSGPSCAEGQAWCEGQCISVGGDPLNCGACRR